MTDEKQNNSEQQEQDQSAKVLKALKAKLRCDNVSAARHAAFNLSWLQEDGFEALKEALFGDAPRRTKAAAAYGLRKTHGRMKKMALELFDLGLAHDNKNNSQICEHALKIMTQPEQLKPAPQPKAAAPKGEIPIRVLSPRRPRTVKDIMNETAHRPPRRRRPR
jgi:hypothetical protein